MEKIKISKLPKDQLLYIMGDADAITTEEVLKYTEEYRKEKIYTLVPTIVNNNTIYKPNKLVEIDI